MEYDNSQEDHGINCVNSNNHLYDDCVIEVILFTLLKTNNNYIAIFCFFCLKTEVLKK